MKSGKQLTGKELHEQQLKARDFSAPCIICDGIQTPENLGSILRVADATGSNKIILLDSEINLKNNKLSKLARKTEQHLNIEKLSLKQFSDLRHLFKSLYALEITSQSISIFTTQLVDCDAIVVGHESKGIREEVLNLCDQTIHLPMFGINGSMNISHALAVFLYEWRRQKS